MSPVDHSAVRPHPSGMNEAGKCDINGCRPIDRKRTMVGMRNELSVREQDRQAGPWEGRKGEG